MDSGQTVAAAPTEATNFLTPWRVRFQVGDLPGSADVMALDVNDAVGHPDIPAGATVVGVGPIAPAEASEPDNFGVVPDDDYIEEWKSIPPDQNGAEHLDVLAIMAVQGGSFVSALAHAWRAADSTNHAKLYRTFGDYWREYNGRRKAAAASVKGGA